MESGHESFLTHVTAHCLKWRYLSAFFHTCEFLADQCENWLRRSVGPRGGRNFAIFSALRAHRPRNSGSGLVCRGSFRTVCKTFARSDGPAPAMRQYFSEWAMEYARRGECALAAYCVWRCLQTAGFKVGMRTLDVLRVSTALLRGK